VCVGSFATQREIAAKAAQVLLPALRHRIRSISPTIPKEIPPQIRPAQILRTTARSGSQPLQRPHWSRTPPASPPSPKSARPARNTQSNDLRLPPPQAAATHRCRRNIRVVISRINSNSSRKSPTAEPLADHTNCAKGRPTSERPQCRYPSRRRLQPANHRNSPATDRSSASLPTPHRHPAAIAADSRRSSPSRPSHIPTDYWSAIQKDCPSPKP